MQQASACVDTGLIAGNVALYAAATRLGAWFHNCDCDRDRLARRLKLSRTQRALFGQTVGRIDR